ncbi:hypothetical protein BCD67_25795, partial [Oscillatoriales cyanobacterium USR001]
MTALVTKQLRKQFTVDEYYKLGELGMLGDGRTELIDGDIVYMAPMGSRHAGCIGRLLKIFFKVLDDRASILSQTPVRLNGRLEPQPDVSILKPRADNYSESHPKTEDIYLLIEVADTTIDDDRNIKSVLYGRAGIIELWIVDIGDELVEVYRNPSVNGYESIQQFRRGETISPLAFSPHSAPS